MKVLNRVILVAALVLLVCSYAATQEMTREQLQKQIIDHTAQRNDLKRKLTNLQNNIDQLNKDDAAKAEELKKCNDDLMALVGANDAAQSDFEAKLDQIDAKINELSKLSNQDLWAPGKTDLYLETALIPPAIAAPS